MGTFCRIRMSNQFIAKRNELSSCCMIQGSVLQQCGPDAHDGGTSACAVV